MDGSSVDFVRGIMAKGVRQQAAPVLAYEILKPVTVEKDGATATLLPSNRLEIEFHIDFADPAIGRQSKKLDMRNGTFARELSDSRTFCRQADVDAMHESGLALGGTLENAVVVDGDDVLSPGGLRHRDEPVRHKMLDALGDLSLAGGPILGRYTGVRAGHAMTNRLLRALFADPSSYRWIDCDDSLGLRLPGVGVGPADLALVA
jgi:UDP-3-O-[3-hydroxymyristoyl] N-acetylglucosamine deacetylase